VIFYSYDRRQSDVEAEDAFRPHVQINTKVNAPIDSRLAYVVETLNKLPKLCTRSSCEGRPNTNFLVHFTYGDTVGGAAEFMNRLFFGMPVRGSGIRAIPRGVDGLLIVWSADNDDMKAVEHHLNQFVSSELGETTKAS